MTDDSNGRMLTPPASPSEPPQPPASTVASLGVIDAFTQGWGLLMADFAQLWLIGFLFMLLTFAVGLLGGIPCIGMVISLVAVLCFSPQLYAGLFYVTLRKVDGEAVQPGDLFEGFRSRFSQSLVAFLPVYGLGLVAGVVFFIIAFMGASGAAILSKDAGFSEGFVGFGVMGMVLCLYLLMIFVSLFFLFIPAAIWDRNDNDALLGPAKTSFWLVQRHFLTVLLFALLGIVIFSAAFLAGTLMLCVGIFLTYPAALMWITLSLSLLYRHWNRDDLPLAGH